MLRFLAALFAAVSRRVRRSSAVDPRMSAAVDYGYGYRAQRLAERMKDPEFAAEYFATLRSLSPSG